MQAASAWAFGVELECYLHRESVMRYWTVGDYHRGIQIPGAPTGWKVERDGSVSRAPDSRFEGLEIVSPKLRGLRGLEDLSGVMLAVTEDCLGRSDYHCGQHIHTDAGPLREAPGGADGALERIAQAARQWLPVLHRVNGERAPERVNNSYCAPIPDGAYWRHNRYQALNFSNVGTQSRNTIEYRLWAGALNIERALLQVAVSVAFTRHFALGLASPDVSVDGLAAILREHPVVPEMVEEFIPVLYRTVELAPELEGS